MKKILICAAFILSLMPLAYAQQTTPITEEQAIEIGKQYAITNDNASPEWFIGSEIDAEFIDNHWFIMFMAAPNPDTGLYEIGNHFSMLLSADGEVLFLNPGR